MFVHPSFTKPTTKRTRRNLAPGQLAALWSHRAVRRDTTLFVDPRYARQTGA